MTSHTRFYPSARAPTGTPFGFPSVPHSSPREELLYVVSVLSPSQFDALTKTETVQSGSGENKQNQNQHHTHTKKPTQKPKNPPQTDKNQPHTLKKQPLPFPHP